MKPKSKRQAARRQRQAERAHDDAHAVYVHINTTGTLRNPIGRVSSLDRAICVGFGVAAVRRDGKLFADGENERRRFLLTSDGVVTLRRIEKWIKRHHANGSKWEANICAPLWDAKWVRQRPGKWVCVEAGEGFA
jgi:hypothetical protein